jgi:Fic family protein
MDPEDRHSKALEPELIADPELKAQQEVKNGFRQFDSVIEQIEFWRQRERVFKLRPSAIVALNRKALEGLTAFAGIYRPTGIEIKGRKHHPPPAHLVPELVEDLCEYVNSNWSRSPLHLASYILWRLNWIHPFVDGNGRTSRAVSFLVLCIRLGYLLPGSPTIPDQISRNKNPYYAALESADKAFLKSNNIEVSDMEALLGALLATQLASVIHDARAGQPRTAESNAESGSASSKDGV